MSGGDSTDGDTDENDIDETGLGGESPIGEGVESSGRSPAGVPATKRNRVKSAVLWGAVGGFAFLVLAQGYLLIGGELPFRYGWLFGFAAAVAVGATGITYLTERRIRAERPKRRT